VCTNPRTCAQAVFAPLPPNESWHHSVGHWVEDDPVVGDGAFSSPGAFGFYPWVDASRTHYGARDPCPVVPSIRRSAVAWCARPGRPARRTDRHGAGTTRCPRGSRGRSLRRYDGKKSTGHVTTI
jgi:hypothetical protein